mmetsp:Transcript_422/g.990  ORF Transcript_422/g.990 Transcript_422/m.990 type:complete len:478 (+) Transcript_422:645-2078(+)|eukprot:CAMPEP_0171491170 /NCGR_PEP_ID=MMETSP0958-20121227/3713_1 /TAXON_ID=87120 /ORGANISM="Aurantiochytrium limacinum, Strain ATCCMYA-1381" /LENGTH=477 /DNA_ID=CAMNT_0012024563 /DNA_START=460 /DNA_END=1893 /DNA_ORIENTATION=+
MRTGTFISSLAAVLAVLVAVSAADMTFLDDEVDGIRDLKVTCSNDSCYPGDGETCRKNKQCTGNSKCKKKSCTCIYDNVWLANVTSQTACDSDGAEYTLYGSEYGICGCPDGQVLSDKGWCIGACCVGDMKARPSSRNLCTLECGGDGETCMEDSYADTEYVCSCPRHKPYFDSTTGKCVKKATKCSASTADTGSGTDSKETCQGNQIYGAMTSSCIPRCIPSTEEMCMQGNTTGCTCEDGMKWSDVQEECVLVADCETETSDNSTSMKNECDSNMVYAAVNSSCIPSCVSDPDTMCAQVTGYACTCEDGMKWSNASNACVDADECESDDVSGQSTDDDTGSKTDNSDNSTECSSNMIWGNMSSACAPQCDYSVVCAEYIGEGCTCPDGMKWSNTTGACVDPTECENACEANQVYGTMNTACIETCTGGEICAQVVTEGCRCPGDLLWDTAVSYCVEASNCSDAYDDDDSSSFDGSM